MPSHYKTEPDNDSFVETMFLPTRLFAPMMLAIVTWVVGAYVALILESPYWNDDTINKNLPAILKASHMSLGSYIWMQISAFVSMDGRFDPGLLAWTFSLFDIFDNKAAYKLVVALLLVLAITATSLCVAAITRNWIAAGTFVLILSGTLQVRLWADGITSFAGVMTLTTALTFGALLVLLVKRGAGWAVLAGVLYAAALLTYEAVFLFAPIMVLIVILSRKDWRPAIALALPAMLAFLTAVSLRLFTNAHPVSEYTLSFAPIAVMRTFAKQMVAAMPLSQWWLGHTFGLPPIAGTLILMCAVLIGIPVFVGLHRLADNAQILNASTIKLFGLLGGWLWVAPAALIAITKRWQTDIPWGQGYISVVYEYFGLAFCLLALWLLISGWLRVSHRIRGLRAWNLGSAAAFALLATVTMAANLSLMP